MKELSNCDIYAVAPLLSEHASEEFYGDFFHQCTNSVFP